MTWKLKSVRLIVRFCKNQAKLGKPETRMSKTYQYDNIISLKDAFSI